MKTIKTTSFRIADKIWKQLGGEIVPVRRTGEIRYQHNVFADTVRVNGRRNGIPPVMISRINQLIRMQEAANDPIY